MLRRCRVSRRFEELAWEPTGIGDVSLRRRQHPVTGIDIFEVKLGDEYLMSSLFTVAEIALADLALNWLGHRELGRPAGTSSSAVSVWATPRAPCWPTTGFVG